jgi:protein O-GlcNAc transferase
VAPAPPPEKLHRAFFAYSNGDLAEAERLCRSVAATRPGLFDAWHLLAVVQAAMGRAEKAIANYDRALALQPGSAEVLVNRGAALYDLRRFADALADCDRAITLTNHNLLAHANRGLALHALGRYDEALAAHDRALALKGDYAEAHANRAATLYALDRHVEALAGYDRALAIDPGNAEANYNRGNVLRTLGRLSEALAAYDRELILRSDHAGALANRGAALSGMRRFGEALASFDRLVAVSPSDFQAYYNRGNVLHDLRRFADALASFDRALALKPDFADAMYNRANTLFEMKLFAEALAGFERALAQNPEHPYALERAASCALQLCDWEKRAHYGRELAANVTTGQSIISPFTIVAYTDDPALQLASARRFTAAAAPVSPLPLRAARRPGKFRIAYLSTDFQEHAVAYLLVDLFEQHDHAQFETSAFSFGRDDGGDMRKRLMAAFDRFEDMRAASDLSVAERLRELDIDVAVDLSGYTAGSRSGVMARRGAPIQVSYVGFPATMGAPFIDYIFVDRIIAPPDAEHFFAEKLVRLPDSYLANDRKRRIGERAPTREEAGLPRDGFVFCCFNNVSKITPDFFDVWMRLLSAVESSVLWLLPSNPAAESNLRAAAAARGVDPARLIFASRMSPEDHLARHRLVDLFLDTLPYNAHTTASDALWTGLPLITLPGRAFSARVAASLLHAIGVPELVAADAREYETLALRLAREPALLASYRQRLAANRLTTPLFDSARIARHIEAAYRHMIERYERGETPASFDVESLFGERRREQT